VKAGVESGIGHLEAILEPRTGSHERNADSHRLTTTQPSVVVVVVGDLLEQ
jgi:hypothetical protein